MSMGQCLWGVMSLGHKKKYYNIVQFNGSSKEEFYFAGFLFGDGFIEEGEGYLVLELKNKDRELIENFKAFMKSNSKIYLRKIKNKFKNGRCKREYSYSSYIRIYCRETIKNLADNYGVTKNKIKDGRIIKKVYEHENFHHFIRGLFDSDGGIHLRPPRLNQNMYNPELYFCGRKEVLDTLLYFFKKKIPKIKKDKKLMKNKEENIYKLVFSGYGHASKIRDIIYEDSKTSLKRKRMLMFSHQMNKDYRKFIKKQNAHNRAIRNNRPIVMVDLIGGKLHFFNTVNEASQSLSVPEGNIRAVLHKRQASARHFVVFYEKDFDINSFNILEIKAEMLHRVRSPIIVKVGGSEEYFISKKEAAKKIRELSEDNINKYLKKHKNIGIQIEFARKEDTVDALRLNPSLFREVYR